MAEPLIVPKEMALTKADFFRYIHTALKSDDFETLTDGINFTDGTRRLEIRLGPEEVRQIALMRIAKMQVTLTLTGYSDDESGAFLKHFDQTYRRGGG